MTREKRLSVIIPVYNERGTVLRVLERVHSLELPGIDKELIVVDDCSRDGTGAILERAVLEKRFNNLKLVRHGINRGKGAAIRSGIQHVTGDVVIIQDADLEYDPADIPRLINPVMSERYNVVYGSRFIGRRLVLFGKNKTPIPSHYIGNRLLTFLTGLLFGRGVTDMETGYKVFNADLIKNIKINSEGFDFEPEITAKLLKRRIRIHEMPINFKPRSFEEGKKITWRDGIRAMVTLFKYRILE